MQKTIELLQNEIAEAKEKLNEGVGSNQAFFLVNQIELSEKAIQKIKKLSGKKESEKQEETQE